MQTTSHDAPIQEEILSGHAPKMFRGQKAAVLRLLSARQGNWVSSLQLSKVALQYQTRIFELRGAGYAIENRTRRVGGKVFGEYRLIAEAQEGAR